MASQFQFYFFIFFIAAALSAIFLVVAKKISRKYSLYDDPQKNDIKRHEEPISFLGGAAMLASFLLCLFLIWVFGKINNFEFESAKILAIFVASIVSWFYGFWDDTYWQEKGKISQKAKIFLQIPVALTLSLIFYSAGFRYQFFDFPLIGIVLASAWFLFIPNAFNLQDGLDGLAAGIAGISLLGFLSFFIFFQNIFLAMVASAIAGAVFSFLIFNWSPASIFMGNNGSYFLGFLISAFAVTCAGQERFFYSLIPILFLGAPITNVLYVFIKRWSNGKSCLSADRSHIHDDLYSATGSVKKSVFMIYFIHFVLVSAGLYLLISFK